MPIDQHLIREKKMEMKVPAQAPISIPTLKKEGKDNQKTLPIRNRSNWWGAESCPNNQN